VKTAGWWVAGGLLLLGALLGAANGAKTPVPVSGSPLLVQVDDENVVNMAAVTIANFTGKDSDGRWYLYIRYVGDPAPYPLVYKDEKSARAAWARITSVAH
jgi:hypothetical protein